MTTTPGESGGKFNKINFKKIRDFKNTYPSKKVHIDGGVNDEIAFILRIHGVKSVVSGSYLVNASEIGSGSFKITVSNVSAGNLGEAIVINFVALKGASS